MARPAGYSSDEEDLYDDYYSTNTRAPSYIQKEPTEAEQKEKKISQLLVSIINGNLEDVLSILKENKIDVDIRLQDDWTMLMLAASTGQLEMVQALIELGADVNGHRELYTVLMAACSCSDANAPFEKSLQIADILIQKGANVNAQTRRRITALSYAAKTGNTHIVNRLLPICDKHAEDNQGWTALFWAVSENKVDVVKQLLEAGLFPEKVDVRNQTPLHYATANECEEILEMLPSKKKKRSAGMGDNMYDLEDIFKDPSKLQFLRDISFLLYGMKCEDLIDYFKKTNVDLLKFLSVTDEELQQIGVKAPYQRERILRGLFKFHRHPYKKGSLPIVRKDETYSTIDLSNSILAAVRQIIVMDAALKYLTQNVTFRNRHLFSKQICHMKEKISKLQKTCYSLNDLAHKCDVKIQPADLISKNSMKKRRRWRTWTSVVGIFAITAVVYYKYNKNISLPQLKL